MDGQPRSRTGWTEVELPAAIRVTCIVSTADGALAGTAGAHLLTIADGQATRVTSFDDAPTRSAWHTPWGGPPDVRSMAVAADGTVYVNVHVGGDSAT